MSARHLVIMGVCGCGKTTLATALAGVLGWEYAEADDFHPAANVQKMSAGIPLDDDDRRPWLESLRDVMTQNAAAGKNSIVSCSALKRSYRDLLAEAEGEVLFLHIHGAEEVLRERLENRRGHFMPPALLPSQLATLQPLQADENGAVIALEKTPSQQLFAALAVLAQASFDVAIVGAGVMGAALAQNFAANGARVALLDREADKAAQVARAWTGEGQLVGLTDWGQIATELQSPRVVFLVVPAGAATDAALTALQPHLAAGDVVIDLGNTYFADTVRRAETLAATGIEFVGCGMSGGEAGARHGAALMFGGSEQAFARLKPLLTAVAARAEDGSPCLTHVGSDGAGHYVKMIHNGQL